ncbi:MAG: hypothetical protein QOH58_2576 [Thermoleophilaceae bacterium]|jgi:hypothetical protein|nr:hypothetical protein [Thermoleophilaceae bacterium]
MATTESAQAPAKGGLAVTVADLRCRYRRDGLRTLLAKIAGRLRAAVYSESEVVVLVKDLRDVTDMSSSEALRVEDLDASHLGALYEFNRKRCNSGADARKAAWLERGYRGYVGYVGEELVGYYWWVDREIEPHHPDMASYGLDIDLQEGEAYGFDFYLLDEHRGGGNSMEFLHKVESGLRDLGYDTLWGYVVAGNKPARWLYGLRGYKPVRKVAARHLLTRRSAFRVTVAGE